MKLFFALFILGLANMALAADVEEDRKAFKIPQSAPVNLIDETQTIRVKNEVPVQEEVQVPSLFITGLFGTLDTTFLQVASHGKTVDYPFSKTLPLVTLQFTDYFNKGPGRWGLSGSVGYSYSEYSGNQKTALHILPAYLAATYRADWKFSQIVIPYGMLGPMLMSYFQRGLDEYNTSQATVIGAGTLGLAFNLNRLGLSKARQDSEIIIQYQRLFAPVKESANWNGNVIQAGGTMAF